MIDDEFNKKQYEKFLHYYLDSNADGHIGGGTSLFRIKFLKKYLPLKSHIFEIGSGAGIDALALQKAGYKVTASDYSEKFVEILKSKQLSAFLFDAKHDRLPGDVDAIYANAVFVHFLPEELQTFLHNARITLQNSKIIFFSVINGIGKERRQSKSGFERDFQYYTVDLIKKIVNEEHISILSVQSEDKWIQIICRIDE